MSQKPVSSAITTVIELSTRKRDDAVRALGLAQRELEQAQQQMQQLQDYVGESQTRWRARAAEGISVILMQHQGQFMARIEHAVQFQRDVIAKLEDKLTQRQQALQATERELASLNKYVERRLHAWQKTQERREQKATDEMAANAYRRQQAEHTLNLNL